MTTASSSETKLTFEYNIFNDVNFISNTRTGIGTSSTTTYYNNDFQSGGGGSNSYEDYSSPTTNLDTDDIEFAPNVDGELTLGCRKCGVDYGSSTELKLHFGAVHSRQTFECCVCNKLFIRRHGFLVHIKRFHEDVTAAKSHPCPFCEQIYTNAEALNEHCHNQHKSIQQICPLCSTQVPDGAMKNHIHMFHVVKEHPLVFTCPSSSVLEQQPENFQAPVVMEEEEVKKVYVAAAKAPTKRKWPQSKPHHCQLCPYETNRSERLRIHVQGVHEQARQFPCNLCEKSFKQKDKLNRHITSVHIKDKRFHCEFCPMSFARKDESDRHMGLVHADPRSPNPNKIEHHPEIIIPDSEADESYEYHHQCPQCSYHCKRSDKLKIHIINAHSDERLHSCNFCLKRFKLKDKLNLHVNSVHLKRKPFECRYCKQGFGRKDAAKRHETKWCSAVKASSETNEEAAVILCMK